MRAYAKRIIVKVWMCSECRMAISAVKGKKEPPPRWCRHCGARLVIGGANPKGKFHSSHSSLDRSILLYLRSLAVNSGATVSNFGQAERVRHSAQNRSRVKVARTHCNYARCPCLTE